MTLQQGSVPTADPQQALGMLLSRRNGGQHRLQNTALHGSNVERLEVVNRMQLEFVLKTKMSGPERGRSHSFRVSTCATIPALKCHAAYTCVCNATHGMPNMLSLIHI